MDDSFQAHHAFAETKQELGRMRGSKYIQSDVGDAYQRVYSELKNGRTVLFSGTPCQVAALKSVLGCNYENLITVDIVCHGVPSQRVFSEYLDHIRRKTAEHSEITAVSFRDKAPKWSDFHMTVRFADGERYSVSNTKDLFLQSFLQEYITRPSCHSCRYAGAERQGDITLGDFWQYRSYSRKFRNDEKGISLVLLNTPKGQTAFSALEKRIVFVSRLFDEAAKGNRSLCASFPASPDRNKFREIFLQNGLEAAAKECLRGNVLKRFLAGHYRWVLDHLYLLPWPRKRL